MRRLLCLLLALMLLCGSAMAEASKVTVTWDADLEGAKAFWAASTGDEGARLDSMAMALVELLEGLKVEWVTQEGGAYLALSLKDTLLLDVGTESGWDFSRIYSNLWSDQYVNTVLPPEAAEQLQKTWNELNAINLEQLAVALAREIDRWLLGQMMTKEQGSFTGDAYEHAAQVYRYSFDDQAVVQLVEGLMLVLEQQGLTEETINSYLGEDIGLYESIRRKNEEVSAANRFSYVLQLACDSQGEYMGADLLVMENDQQVMTLAHGQAANGWQLVWGYGFEGMNYYFDLEVIAQQDSRETEVGLFVFCDPNGLGFREIQHSGNYLLQMATANFCPQKDGQWGTLAEVLFLAQQVDCYVVEGISSQADATAEYAIHWYRGENLETPLQTIHVNVQPCEPMTWNTGSMTPIDTLSDDGGELLTQVVEGNTQEMLLKLFKLVPTQLLTMLML